MAQITRDYFADTISPGLALYEENLADNTDLGPERIDSETKRAHRLLATLLFD